MNIEVLIQKYPVEGALILAEQAFHSGEKDTGMCSHMIELMVSQQAGHLCHTLSKWRLGDHKLYGKHQIK